ncbi:barstar family protein [Variovorax paradoxus]|uniref:barstar family protein n=1 Tax=Variovorax paradoxus TaxID=34073 RepID=UPI00277E014E|nr:barstar family protein [Variovorax paradoxus]MDP9929111.1 hypothetical protein [Variovorax paradoxus]
MNISDGVLIAKKDEVLEICEEKAKLGWRVFDLPSDIGNKFEFFDAVRAVLPLDPPLHPVGENWDALNDSLWAGLHSLRTPGNIIVWRRFDLLKNNSRSDFEIAVGVFNSIANTISDPKYGGGFSNHLIVFLTEN